MMQLVADKRHYLEEFEQFARDLAEPDWLRGIRQSAIASFERLGFPSARTEDWRFTNVAPLTQVPFELADETGGDVESLLPPSPIRLVFVNGHWSAELSTIPRFPRNVLVATLETGLRRQPDVLEAHLAHHADYKNHPFTALNTAFLSDGALIVVPKGTILEQPIEVVYVSAPGGRRTVSHPRTLVLAEESSQLTVVERFVGDEASTYFTNAVTEIVVGENAVVDHYKLQVESPEAFHIANTQVILGRSSNFTTHYIALGGSLVRNEVRAFFKDEGAEATVNGLYLASGRQHIDNFTVIDHAKPHCASHELYKGILADQAHGVFNGKIFVRPDAQKTDAKQTNKVLLLSQDAVINTKPQLEIFADDVKCTHGATVGQLDAEALFYMRARGIGIDEARRLLIYAFANDIVGRIKVDSVRDYLEGVLMKLESVGDERSLAV